MGISAVIVAGGRGTRMGCGINKPYLNLAGRPIVVRTLEVFDGLDELDEIVLVVHPDDMKIAGDLMEQYGIKKPVRIVTGGESRQQSVFNGLKGVNPGCEIVLIHDAARPFVQKDQLLRCIEAARRYGAASLGVRVKDTIKICNQSGFAEDTPERETLWAIQTPQVFKYQLIMKAHQMAVENGWSGTDDTVLAEKMGHEVKIIEGSYRNIKITTPEDMVIAEAFCSHPENK